MAALNLIIREAPTVIFSKKALLIRFLKITVCESLKLSLQKITCRKTVLIIDIGKFTFGR